eukprot:TRINITY_DN32631_c0_g1_i1.p1 TRINITY_DN32631_c0_g1~~TRINITY_DN32631_c0_g1_i1.p1  ORF type:complete len:709 (-),score=138.25 TRINITY_DN32631_c0_g1_i1:23-2149(-)
MSAQPGKPAANASPAGAAGTQNGLPKGAGLPDIKIGNPCWIWLSAAKDELLDATACPDTEEEYKKRLQKGLRGTKWARLCPARVREFDDAAGTAKVIAGTRWYQVQKSQIVDWREAFFLFDILEQTSQRPAWFDAELKTALEGERAKNTLGVLRSSLYVRHMLHRAAATGPAFVDSAGKKHAHRRIQKTLLTPKKDGKRPDGMFEVEEFLDYLPPWAAFAHPKCGTYQDWYLVKWSEPARADYSACEHGGSEPNTTWEPDEILPDRFDQMRSSVKVKWMHKQKEREMKQAEESSQKKKQDAASEAAKLRQQPAAKEKQQSSPDVEPVDDEKAVRKRSVPFVRQYNPKKLKLTNDVIRPELGHTWTVPPSDVDDASIKKGWPKSEKEYPGDHLPCNPPGCCEPGCDCMEDWHMGIGVDHSRGWFKTAQRVQEAQAALDNFAMFDKGCRRRGEVSKRHYLEPHPPPNVVNETVSNQRLRDYVVLIWECANHIMQNISMPMLVTTEDEDSAMLLANLGRITCKCGNLSVSDSFAPLRYGCSKPPPGIVVESTGAMTVEKQVVSTWPADSMTLLLDFVDLGPPDEHNRISFNLNRSRTCMTDTGLTLKQFTVKLCRFTHTIPQPEARRRVQDVLQEIYDFHEKQPLMSLSLGTWARVVADVADVVRSVWKGHVLPPGDTKPQAPPADFAQGMGARTMSDLPFAPKWAAPKAM